MRYCGSFSFALSLSHRSSLFVHRYRRDLILRSTTPASFPIALGHFACRILFRRQHCSVFRHTVSRVHSHRSHRTHVFRMSDSDDDKPLVKGTWSCEAIVSSLVARFHGRVPLSRARGLSQNLLTRNLTSPLPNHHSQVLLVLVTQVTPHLSSTCVSSLYHPFRHIQQH